MAIKTRFGLEGYGVRRAGAFAGKRPSIVTAITNWLIRARHRHRR